MSVGGRGDAAAAGAGGAGAAGAASRTDAAGAAGHAAGRGGAAAAGDGGGAVAAVAEEPLSDVAYCYDGSLEGLLSAIFEAYLRREHPRDISAEGRLQLRLGQALRPVSTDLERAERVRAGICRSCGPASFEAVARASLSDDADTGGIVYRFVRHAMAQGSSPGPAEGRGRAPACAKRPRQSGAPAPAPRAAPGPPGAKVLDDLAHPNVEPLLRLERAVSNERHRMLQFLRFEHLEGGLWFARCNPSASVVPLIMDWFSARFNTQPFIIFDEVHGLAGVYEKAAWYLVRPDRIDLPAHAGDEKLMQQAWKRFYDTVAVEARYNPELRRQFMPRRFWKNLTEMQDRLAGREPDGPRPR